MQKSEIIAAIEKKVDNTDYSIWRIGITNDPAERKQYWTETEEESTSFWSQWQADSLADAQAIESYFINKKKMKGGTGGDMSAHRSAYVYVF